MIVIDTSALIAIHWCEAERPALATRISTANRRMLPSSGYLAFAMATRGRPLSMQWLDRTIDVQGIEIVPIDAAIAYAASAAAKRYGDVAGHPAGLSFADCLSYGVAKHTGAPLLYKGSGFALTDIESALDQ